MSIFSETCLAGPLALEIVWNDEAVTGLKLSWAEGKSRQTRTPEGEAVQTALCAYVAGQGCDWPQLPYSWDGVPPFSRRVLAELAKVPAGQKVSYGWLATRVGHPKAARAIGRVMAKNRFPLLYPCHRVVGSSGALTGFGPGIDMKQYLLELEGVLSK